MNYIFDIIMIPAQIIIFLFTIYYFTIAFLGFYQKKEQKITEPKSSFAVVIAAHNEENVIGQLLDNLKMLRYPNQLYDVYVIADNCKDKTAQIAKEKEAIVCERFSDTQKGKGYAIEWMFSRLFKMDKKYDGVVVFDADNLVHPNFLMEMNNRLCKGEKIIQGYLDSKNPDDTWISGTFSLSFWVVNHIWHLAKYNIGLSSVLGGTGMCISYDVLKRYGWGATCLTEDMEFTMKALLSGIKTTWAHDAIVYDEKPLTFMQSWKQRKRWAQGHFDIAERYIPSLIREGIKQRKIFILDGVIHLLQPYFLLFSTAFIILNYVQYVVPFYTNILYMFIPIRVFQIIAVGQYIFPMIVLFKIKASLKSWLYGLLYPLFIYSWIPITFVGFLDRHQREWVHTAHTRGLSYTDLLAESASDFQQEELLPKQVIKVK